MDRRTFLGAGAAAALTLPRSADAAAIPIIDTHIHLFDVSRPQGVPWPPKNNAVLYHTALPDRYRKIAVPLGITGAIEVEASPWLEDNQWVLDVAARDTIIVGTVGDLEPGKPDFRKQLERFHRNPLFRGIRYGNLWDRNLGTELARPEFVSDLKALADADLELDSANPTPALLADILRVTDRVPNLRVVIDHLAGMAQSPEEAERRKVLATQRELAKRPHVWVKVSAVLHRVNGRTVEDPAVYRPRLDEIWGIFGEDRLLYASDWPNSDQIGEYPQVLKVVRDYFMAKGPAVAEKFFWKNSVAAYRWVKREPGQPQLPKS
jgi:predicted TIM-barrel fold metal-dependent hydrolase